eukprot:GHVS01002201.1.p1 GENE.GHVS01002201.1~~GHVS01002201.1.p1  ORF type:complete len:409 (-),score=38.09 GHVS01002201.1:364-1590(-)
MKLSHPFQRLLPITLLGLIVVMSSSASGGMALYRLGIGRLKIISTNYKTPEVTRRITFLKSEDSFGDGVLSSLKGKPDDMLYIFNELAYIGMRWGKGSFLVQLSNSGDYQAVVKDALSEEARQFIRTLRRGSYGGYVWLRLDGDLEENVVDSTLMGLQGCYVFVDEGSPIANTIVEAVEKGKTTFNNLVVPNPEAKASGMISISHVGVNVPFKRRVNIQDRFDTYDDLFAFLTGSFFGFSSTYKVLKKGMKDTGQACHIAFVKPDGLVLVMCKGEHMYLLRTSDYQMQKLLSDEGMSSVVDELVNAIVSNALPGQILCNRFKTTTPKFGLEGAIFALYLAGKMPPERGCIRTALLGVIENAVSGMEHDIVREFVERFQVSTEKTIWEKCRFLQLLWLTLTRLHRMKMT